MKNYWFNKFDSVQCFIAELVRFDYRHLHFCLSLRSIKCIFFDSNEMAYATVQSLEFNSLCSSAGVEKNALNRLPVSSLKYQISEVFKSSN